VLPPLFTAPGHPTPPGLQHRFPILSPFLALPLPSMALTINCRPLLSGTRITGTPPALYKVSTTHRFHHTISPLSQGPSRSTSPSHRAQAAVAQPLRRHPCSGEHPLGFATSPSSSPTPANKHKEPWCLPRPAPAAHGCAHVSCHPLVHHGLDRATRSTVPWTWSMDFSIGKIILHSLYPVNFAPNPLFFL
jgi:hypothetical protein